MRAISFYHGDCTIPVTGIASAAPHMASAKSTILLNRDFTATSCCGVDNEPPFPGYAAQFNWIDENQNIGQVELVQGYLMERRVVVRVDWQPVRKPALSTVSPSLPPWAWDAMLSTGSKITLEVKNDPSLLSIASSPPMLPYKVTLADALGNSYDSGWLPHPVAYNRIITESMLVGAEDDCKATFGGLDASFKMEFADPTGIQYALSDRAGEDSFNYGDIHNAYYRITGEDSNADEDNLSTDSWTFTQFSP